eukprot:3754283-Pleurochrysis_carterae.AAC.1
MAAQSQQHRTRQERAGRDLSKPRGRKTRTEIDGNRRERPESLRYASPRPREGRQWTLGVPPQGHIH